MQAVPQDPHVVAGVIATLRRLLGEQHVLTDHAEREFYSQDVYRAGQLPAAVIRPGSVEELAAALQAIAPAGLPLVPRGGGMSYTDGFLPAQHDSITLDLLRLDRVLEINPDDCYVTVECGATWKRLCDALEPHGVRTPYYGPLSGLYATIGGALSQGSVFLGSGRYGTAADSVIGLDVMLADGSILKLGSHANRNGQPFFRQVGPDTMAMFLSDTGSLGIKARATFRLIRPQRESRYLSFSFDTAGELFAAMAEVARADVVGEQFAFDPGLQAVRMKRVSLMEDAKQQVLQRTGIPVGHILISATHSHSTVSVTSCFQSDPMPAYQKFMAAKIAEGIEKAVSQLKPARIGWGKKSNRSVACAPRYAQPQLNAEQSGGDAETSSGVVVQVAPPSVERLT